MLLSPEYVSGLKTAVGSPRTADSSFQTKFWTADSSFQIKSGLPTAVFRLNLDRRQQFSDQVLDRRQQFSDAWVLFGVQIVTLRPIFSKTRHVAHRVTYTTEKSSFRTIIWASMSKRVYFPFKSAMLSSKAQTIGNLAKLHQARIQLCRVQHFGQRLQKHKET